MLSIIDLLFLMLPMIGIFIDSLCIEPIIVDNNVDTMIRYIGMGVATAILIVLMIWLSLIVISIKYKKVKFSGSKLAIEIFDSFVLVLIVCYTFGMLFANQGYDNHMLS